MKYFTLLTVVQKKDVESKPDDLMTHLMESKFPDVLEKEAEAAQIRQSEKEKLESNEDKLVRT